MIRNLHLLRIAAAVSVVYFHITSTSGLGLEWDVGSRGVDVFFVISGFIIAYIGSRNPKHFMARRLIRIVPFYWAATIVVFATARLFPHLFRSTDASWGHLLPSLLFFPHESVSGEIQPTLILGWSLNFEMFFYVVFAAALLVSTRWAPLFCASLIVGWILSAHAWGGGSVAGDFYARPTALEFCFGILAFYLLNWCERRKTSLSKRTLLKWILVCALVAGVLAIVLLEKAYRDTLPRYLIAGIPAFIIVVCALLLERVFGVFAENKAIHLLGESSYVIYLIHPYIVFAVLRLLIGNPDSLSPPMIGLVNAGLIGLTCATSACIHVFFEKPVMEYLRRRLLPT